MNILWHLIRQLSPTFYLCFISLFVPFDLSRFSIACFILIFLPFLLLMNSSSICFWTWNTTEKKKSNVKVKQIFLLLLLHFCQLKMHENDELLGNVKDASGRPTRAIFYTFFNWILHFCAELILVTFFEFLSWFWMVIVMMVQEVGIFGILRNLIILRE